MDSTREIPLLNIPHWDTEEYKVMINDLADNYTAEELTAERMRIEEQWQPLKDRHNLITSATSEIYWRERSYTSE